jgi:hypothetical protein
MSLSDVYRQTARSLLAPFQGAVRVSWALSGGCTTGSFQEEYVAMLKRGMVAYEERFLW